jgi:hypothetical protein
VHLTGPKAGVWADFAAGLRGDALGLVCAVLGLDLREGMIWSCRWLGIDHGPEARKTRARRRRRAGNAPVSPIPSSSLPSVAEALQAHEPDQDRWRRFWDEGRPITGTAAEHYLTGRGLRFDDPLADVLRFHPRRARRDTDNKFECHPAMMALLCDIVSGVPVGIINIFLRPDGIDRIRDRKGKTVTGRAGNAAVMLSAFDEPTYGLTICEGIETGIGLLMDGCAPVWACGSAGTLARFPVLAGIECLTIDADADETGINAARKAAARWRGAGRDVVISAPATGDWADMMQRRSA